MPPYRKKIVLIAVSALTIGVVGGSLLARSHSVNAASNTCSQATQTVHRVTITNGRVSPEFTDGVLCDKLIITNTDNVTREIAFGPHEDHVPYDGIAEKFLNKGQSFTITLSQTGMVHFHDHLDDSAMGYFSVTK